MKEINKAESLPHALVALVEAGGDHGEFRKADDCIGWKLDIHHVRLPGIVWVMGSSPQIAESVHLLARMLARDKAEGIMQDCAQDGGEVVEGEGDE